MAESDRGQLIPADAVLAELSSVLESLPMYSVAFTPRTRAAINRMAARR